MPCLAHVLTVLGGLAEIGGLLLVIVEIVKVQQREFPQHRGWVRRTLAWMRRVFRKPPAQTVHVTGIGSAEAFGNVSLEVTRGPATTLEGRVERVDKQIEDFKRKQREDKAEVERRIAEAGRRADETADELRKLIAQRDEERRKGLADALLLQKIGVAAFIVGVGLSVWGNLAPC
jgi:hypothetical protein